MLVVKFGLSCQLLEFLVKNEYDDGNLIIWCYELMFWSILMFLWSMSTVGEVSATILGPLRSKLGFWEKFGVISREEPKILCSCSWWTRQASSPCAVASDAGQTHNFGCYQSFGLFPDIPKYSFWCVLIDVLTYNATVTRITWIWNGIIKLRQTLSKNLEFSKLSFSRMKWWGYDLFSITMNLG